MKSWLLISAALAALVYAPALAQPPKVAKSAMSDLSNNAKGFVGHVSVTEAPGGVLILVEVQGLPPGWHGIHLHEKGDCSAADFTSAGAHMNHPTAKKPHGLMNPAGPDFGDLPNLYVAADGTGKAEAYTTLTKFADLTDTDGSALVVHASKDDHLSQPIGGAGARIACAVIK